MNDQTNIIDWSSPDVLLEIVNSIKTPLSSIMAANDKAAKQIFGEGTAQSAAEITLENSKIIADLIEEVIKKTKVAEVKEPLFFKIYRDSPQVRAMCSKEVDAKRISKTDKTWLLDLEQVVFNEPQLDQLSLFGLAFEVSVSERQLHRNIKKFLSLTPNKYIRILKLHKAKKLLEEYAYRTISEVSYAVGFAMPTTFQTSSINNMGPCPKICFRHNSIPRIIIA